VETLITTGPYVFLHHPMYSRCLSGSQVVVFDTVIVSDRSLPPGSFSERPRPP
jgi:hypothetical protein